MTNGPQGASPDKGLFITVEGGDGVGKSTQINRLAALLSQTGREVAITREPGGSQGAEEIRNLLVRGDGDRWSPLSEALLLYAARRDHLEKTILPALARGAIVISDRFEDSSFAYQAYAGDLGAGPLRALHELVVAPQDPDLTFILDAPVEITLARATSEKGELRFEEKGAAFHEKVRAAFLEIARANPARCVVIDAAQTPELAAQQIEDSMRARFAGLFDG